jgi:hypothetical protein
VLHWIQRSAVATSIKSNIFPELTDTPGGNYGDTATYLQEDVLSLVLYAKDRGVHVVIENGGYEASYAFGLSHPELVACPNMAATVGYPKTQYVAMNPLSNKTFEFLRLYWGELDMSSTDFVHLGGDLLGNTSCWDENQEIQAYMQSTGKTYDQIQQDFYTYVWTTLMPLANPPIFTNNQSMMYRAGKNWNTLYPIDQVRRSSCNVPASCVKQRRRPAEMRCHSSEAFATISRFTDACVFRFLFCDVIRIFPSAPVPTLTTCCSKLWIKMSSCPWPKRNTLSSSLDPNGM